jgi:hypothetical protein
MSTRELAFITPLAPLKVGGGSWKKFRVSPYDKDSLLEYPEDKGSPL